jgi:hypothetical protein
MANDDWLERLQGLVYRLESLGVAPDLAGMGLCDLWGVYCYLRHIAEG